MQKVCVEFGGMSIEIPRQADKIRASRDAKMLKDLAAGMSIRNIALKYEMTERNVGLIKRKYKK